MARGGDGAPSANREQTVTVKAGMSDDVELSDSLLLDGVRHGDEEAFSALFLRYHDGIYRALLHLLQRGDEADDATQEVFLKLHQRPPSGGREHNVSAWLYRVALNLGYNVLRSERRRDERYQHVGQAMTPSKGAMDPASALLEGEERAQVRAVLATLTQNYQAALILRHEGWSYREIASVLGIAANAVGTVLARAEKQFKTRYLEEVGGSRRDGK